jgi:hypothetical protein
MQIHYGNIGAALQGIAVIGILVGALIKGPAFLRAGIERRRAQAEAARAQAELAREQAETERLTRRARLSGWSAHGINSFSVELVKDPAEIDRARDELSGGGPTAYAVLRVTSQYENPNTEGGRNLRGLIEEDGYLARCPTAAEKEALRHGLDEMGIPRSAIA